MLRVKLTINSADGQAEEWLSAFQTGLGLHFERAAQLGRESQMRLLASGPNSAMVMPPALHSSDGRKPDIGKRCRRLGSDARLAGILKAKLIATVSPTQPLQLWEAESGNISLDSKNPNLNLTDSGGDARFSSDGERIILRRSKDLGSVISVEQRRLIS